MDNTSYKKINEFVVNERTYGHFIIKHVKKGITAQNKPFMDITLSDKTGDVVGKLWDSNSFQEETLVANKIVYATGSVALWDNKLQLKLDHISLVEKGFDPIDFVKAAPISVDDMMKEIYQFVEEIDDEEIQLLVNNILIDNEDSFKIHPAAKGMHHAIYGGLAYHTLTMLRSGKALLSVYPFLKKSLIFGGIILHDLEKLREMAAENGITSDYTRRGKLLGHIIQGILVIEEYGKKLEISPAKIEVLQHLVAGHHGKGEWGSPQPPKMAEAHMIHFIDNMDAKMYMIKEALDNTKPDDEFTGNIRGLDNTPLFIYKP